jgi:tRNA modification GTPase
MSACDTIAAIATPNLPSAIGILRLSGPGAIQAVQAVFTPLQGLPLDQRPDRTLVYGLLRDRSGAVIDQALATISHAPHSYTGEDTAELQCHGSPTVLSLALEALFAAGARQAGPGEFTRRAFLNGKLDLTQAEAVADLIDAETPAAARQAAGQLSGALARRVGEIYDALVDVSAHFHAVLDYPDEDIDPFTERAIEVALSGARQGLRSLLDTYRRGQITREGVPTAIIGPPNAGKSSLLNALVGYDRAIVTNIPGTTRDTVEETCILGGILLRLIDTAGLRDTADPVEQLGVERSRAAMARAGLILVLQDQSAPATGEDLALLKRAVDLAPTILVVNKCDLSPAHIPAVSFPLPPTVTGSVTQNAERLIDALGQEVAALFPQGTAPSGEVLTNLRQAEAAGRALESVERAQTALEAGITPDALLTDVEEAMTALGELTGRNLREDVTARIFQRFCVGK